jgi:transposase InsO family protein
METIDNNPKERPYSISTICKGYFLTRDAFYKHKKRYVRRIKIENQVLEIVHERRRTLPREGARKLMRALKMDFEKYKIKIGRDQLLRILRDNDLLIRRKKYSSRTTNSHHRFYKYKNSIKELEINRPNQVWAADITYIRTIKGFCYLAL